MMARSQVSSRLTRSSSSLACPEERRASSTMSSTRESRWRPLSCTASSARRCSSLSWPRLEIEVESPSKLAIGERSSDWTLARSAALGRSESGGIDGAATTRSARAAWTISDSIQRARLAAISRSLYTNGARAFLLVNSSTATVFPPELMGVPM